MAGIDVIVVGAGIIGVNAALSLQERGLKVRLLDRTGICAEASQRNAGAFAFTEIMPLASPGIMLKAPKWLLDPLGPLSIPPSYAPKILPWMFKFWRASLPDRHKASIEAQYRLMQLSQSALERQITELDGEHLMQREGELQLFEGARAFYALEQNLLARDQYGIEYSKIESAAAIAEIQPGLSERFSHAIFSPAWMNTVDPKRWTEFLAARFIERGGVFEQTEVNAVRQEEVGATVFTQSAELETKHVVVASGAWSNTVAKSLGEKFPLETERGYNTTLSVGAFDLKTQLTFGEHGFVISRINDGIRVGGAVELGGLNLPPNYKRAEKMLGKAASFLPGLRVSGGEQWMGFRPSMPDSLPVISRSSAAPSVVYAFGHGHLGLTQAAGTGQLITSLVANEEPPIPMAPYSATRF